jgi:hypothetical protein
MSCADFDWKGFVLGEATAAERTRLESHLAGCASCRGEVDQLRVAMSTLERLPQLEPPRRISFVSDPVLEPSVWRRFWRSGPQLGFAAAAMLSCAILVHAFVGRTPAPTAPAVTSALSQAEVDARIQQEVERRLPASMAGLRKDSDATLERVSEIEKRMQRERLQDQQAVRDSFGYLERQIGLVYRSANQAGGD